MRLCHLSQRRVGVLGIGRLIVFLFRQCIAFCIMLSAVMGCLNDRSGIATFFEKLAHFFRLVRKIRVITAQTSESKKLRIGNGIFDMGWVK